MTQRARKMTVADAPQPSLSRRERNKQEKAARIKTAARELFLSQGYDDATMRQIAHGANVGLGTLFSYASDKRDLLFLIYNDDQDALTVEAFSRNASGNFVDQVIGAFAVFYRFFARQSEFMTYVLRELTFYTSGHQAGRFQRGREAIIDGLERLVREAKQRGELLSREDDRVIAQLLFGIYQAEIRRWLARTRPSPTQGLKRLRRMMQIVVDGLKSKGSPPGED